MCNLPVLRCADSETADLIYLDPSFNFGRKWEDSADERNKRALASFKDTWTLSDTHADEKTLSAANYPRVKNAINIRIES